MSEKIFAAGEVWKVSCPNCNSLHVLTGLEKEVNADGWPVGTVIVRWHCAVCSQRNYTASRAFVLVVEDFWKN